MAADESIRFLSIQESINGADLCLVIFVRLDLVIAVEVLDVGITVV